MKPHICASCGKMIQESYLKVLDNFLQVKYFDDDEDNVFCSSVCLADYMSAEWFDLEETED